MEVERIFVPVLGHIPCIDGVRREVAKLLQSIVLAIGVVDTERALEAECVDEAEVGVGHRA